MIKYLHISANGSAELFSVCPGTANLQRENGRMDSKIRGTDLPSVLALAYIGDARHTLYVRRMLVEMGIAKSGELNRVSLDYVTCEAQAKMYERIKEILTEEEADVFKRARNSTHLNKPKRACSKDYRVATGFEAVIGMLEWLGDEERLEFLLKKSLEEEKENDSED